MLTLDRPEALNAFNQPMASALSGFLDEIAEDASLRAVLLQANGKYFCAGGDVGWFDELSQADRAERQAAFNTLIETVHGVILSVSSLRLPVVAAVQGGASGFGIGLMMACDFVLTSPASVFRTAYLDLGAPADGGMTWALPRLVGARRARELIMLSERFLGEQALAMDLVNRLVEPQDLAVEAWQLTERLAAGPTQAYGQIKRLLAQSFESSLPAQLQAEQKAFLDNAENPDFSEGLAAFAEKRRAQFCGR